MTLVNPTMTITCTGHANITFQIDEAGGSGTDYAPPPNAATESYSRAIVKHQIPGHEGDLFQDMGANSSDHTFEGLADKTNCGALYELMAIPQLDANGVGICTVEITNNAGTKYIDLDNLVLKTFSLRYVGGFKKWYRYVIFFDRADGV